jgi:single-strand DNA-binding protein
MYNKTILVGHIGGDAIVRNVDNESFVVNFNVADSKRIVDTERGEEIQKTTWFSCSYWLKKEPKVAEYLTKGTLVCVEGEISSHIFIGKDGQPQVDLKLRVSTLKLLSSTKEKQ